MILFSIFAALFFALTYRTRSSIRVREVLRYDPSRVLRAFILIVCALWLLPLYERHPDLKYGWFGLYFAAATISVMALGFGTRIRVPQVAIKGLPATWKILVTVSFPFAAYYLATGAPSDIAALGHLTLYELRAEHWERFGTERNVLVSLIAIAAFPAAHFWPMRSPKSPVFWYSLLLFGLFALRATADGSRTSVMFSLVVCLLLLHTRFNFRPLAMIRRRPKSFAVLLASVVAVSYWMFYHVMLERVPGLEDNAAAFIARFRGEPTPLFYALDSATGGVFGIVTLTLSYFPSTITHFNLFASGYDGPLEWGVYNFPLLDSFVGKDWFAIREDIADFWWGIGMSTNPWSTAYRDWMVDFGVVGSLLFGACVMLLLGMLIGSAARRSDMTARLVAAYATAFALVTPLISPLLILELSMPLYGLAFVYGISTQREQPAKRKSPLQIQGRYPP